MKIIGKIKYIIFLLIFIILVIIIKSSISKNTSLQYTNVVTGIDEKCGRVNICVDPRLELLASIELNSGFYNIVDYHSEYKNDMKKYFRSVRNHQVIKMFRSLSKEGLYVDVPPDFMLHLSKVPDLEIEYEIDDELINLFTRDDRTTDLFLQNLRNYAMQANLQLFFDQQDNYYWEKINNMKSIISKRDYVKDIEDYYGIKQSSYNIIISPLFEGNYGLRLPSNDNRFNLYAVIGGSDYKDNQDNSDDVLRDLIWHEFSHSFINPITDKYIDLIENSEVNFESIKEDMREQGYTSWYTTINEHIIRAVTVRLTEIVYGEDAANKLIYEEKEKGFIYIDSLCSLLQYYENHRDEHSTIEHYYPYLLEAFDN